MAWNPIIPATNADLLSAPVRDNFSALDTALMAALATLTNGSMLTKAAGPVIGGIPAVATGAVLASAGVTTAPAWNASPTLTGLTLSGLTAGSVLFAGSGGVLSQDNANFFFDDTNNNLRLFGGGVGTSGQGVLALGPSATPTTSPVDTVQLWGGDFANDAGSHGLEIRDERGGRISLASHSNGGTYMRMYDAAGTIIVDVVASATASVGTLSNHAMGLMQNGAARINLGTDGYIYLLLPGLAARGITYGAVDSGGAGYRMLRINN